MPMDRGTPDLVRHCVAAVAKQYGGDTSKAFAICVAQLQKNGYLKPGTMELTSAGKAKEKEHESEPDAAKKLKSYEKLLKANRKEEAVSSLAEWGSSDQSAMNRRIHRDLDSPEEPPTLRKVMFAAEDAVEHYWSDWEEYKTDRDGLVKKAARYYYKAYFPDFLDGMGKMLAPKKESVAADFDRLMNPSERSGFEDLPRGVSRRYETVSKQESSMDAMRRLAGLTPRHTDRASTPSREHLAEAAPLDVLEQIAKKHLDIPTLVYRKSDRLDFHEVGVGTLRDALEAAYEAGMKAAKK